MNNRTTFVLAGLIFAGIVGGTAFHVRGGTAYLIGLVKPDPAIAVNKALAAQAQADRAQLPLKVNTETTLIEEAVKGAELTYTYTLGEAAIAPIRSGEGAFKLEVTKKVCASSLARQVRDGARLSYVYYNADRSQKVTEFSVTDCGTA